jgi:hypothetical protein|tara:strand:+ start:33 stop:359 length:327 start_codon:yes stop_codon:yes gene_type:complete
VSQEDIINSPSHYTQGIETIKIIRAKLTDEEYRGYLKGTIMKYNTRIGLKGSEQDASNDAGKLSWYAIKLNEFLNEGNHKPAEIEKANEDIADEILNGKYCVGGTCED